MLSGCEHQDLPEALAVVELLLGAGAPITQEQRDAVSRLGRSFETRRAGYHPDRREPTAAALQRMYELFGVEPAPQHEPYDGVSPIVVSAADWRAQHVELWNLLVPAQGAAPVVQGEVIRITGRIGNELLGNGGVNWDDNYRLMVDALVTHLGSGQRVAEIAEVQQLAATIRAGVIDEPAVMRLTELAVGWVIANPEPRQTPLPAYRR